MIEVFRKQKFQLLIFIHLVFVISFFTFWKAFSFDFWGEDWEQMWYTVFDPAKINNPFELREHAIVIYQELLLSNLFKFNTLYWQITGYLLKVLDAFAISLLMLGLTKSRKVGFFSGLIFASSVGGLASVAWVAAHASILIIPILCVGIYFWVIRKMYPLALIFLLISFLGDPSRSIFGCLFVILWEILSIFQDPKKVYEGQKRIFILVVSLIVSYFILQYTLNFTGKLSIGYNLSIVFSKPFTSLDNFLTNIGNLLVGWIIPIQQNLFSISMNNIYGKLAGYLFLFQTIFLFIRFLQKRSESAKILLLFSLWIPLFFFPNWFLPNQEMIGNGQVIGVTHRYFTLSVVGLACYLGYALAKIKNNYLKYFLLFSVVISNILMSNKILEEQSRYRSTKVTKPIWDKIEKEVPEGEENSILFIQGEDKFRVNDISQVKIPFAIRRGIQSYDMWPVSTSDPGVVKRYLCGNNENRRIVPLDHLHSWFIRENGIDNVSEKVREEFSGIDCRDNQL